MLGPSTTIGGITFNSSTVLLLPLSIQHAAATRAGDGDAFFRGPLHMRFVAALGTVLVMISSAELHTPDDWLRELRSQFGERALVLSGGSDNEPQFLQPVLIGLGEIKPFNITETDHLMAANRHVLKVANEATPEMAFFALMASTWRHNGGIGNPAGARSRLLTVWVRDGVTIGSEITSLAAAYAATNSNIVGRDQAIKGNTMKYQIWYMKPSSLRGIVGSSPDPNNLSATHVHLKDIEADDQEDALSRMRAENWSPNGEARDLLQSKGLQHTTMTIGDVLVDESDAVYLVTGIGFSLLPKP